MSELYSLQGVGCRYGRNWVLKGMDLRIRRGEILGIIGPNGAGKTSLLKLLGGLLRPAEGEIRLELRQLTSFSRSALARRIGMVPQQSSLTFPYTVEEVVLMGRSPYLSGWAFETDEDYRIARAAMERMEVREWSGRLFDELSGGERQRVIIARTLTQQPEVLLLDEPVTFLDLYHQARIYSILEELNRTERITVVVVMHDLNVASRLCGRLLLLSDGRIVRQGTPWDVLTETTIEQVYRCRCLVDSHPGTGRPRVTVISAAT
jgi:cobalamin transport system ATP-binding protein